MRSTLEGAREPPLMTSTGSGDAAGQDLASFADEAAQSRHLFVVDQVDLLRTEVADLLVRLSVALIGCWRHGFLGTPLEGDVIGVDIAGRILTSTRWRGSNGGPDRRLH